MAAAIAPADASWIHEILVRARLEDALNVVGLREPHRLQVVVDGRRSPDVALDGDLAESCGRALAAALLARQDVDPRPWTVAVLASDAETHAELLVAEWHGAP